MNSNRNFIILKLYLKPILISLIIGFVIYWLQIYGALIGKINFGKIPFNLVLDFLYYNIGWLISVVIPSTVLFSTIFVFGRLPYENLFQEFKYERHSFSYFLYPVGVIAILLSIILYFHNDYILSEYNYKAKNIHIQLSRLTTLPNNNIEADDMYLLPRSEREMNLDMLKDQINYFLKLKNSKKENNEQVFDYINSGINRTETEIQKRYAISTSPLFLIIFAIPFGFLIRSKSTLSISGLGIILSLIYWIAIIYFNKLVPNSNPLLLWLPNVVFLIIGIVLLSISNIRFKKFNSVS